MSIAEFSQKKPVQRAELSVLALERHYSVSEIAELWAMSEKSVRRLFANEAGVLSWGHEESRTKRGYISMRIPESVVIRVHQRRQKTG
jgi:AraC-like DNA-binding protein